ncbi:MAG TPA: transposase [Ktedonobacterales bacterium]|jgi:putative transposase
MPGRIFTREFKLDLVRQLATGAKRPAQVCRDHGLANSVLARWRQEYTERGEAAFAPKALPSAAQTTEERLATRIADLERFCGQLALENAVLKKALQSLQAVRAASDAPSRSATP